MKVKKSAKTRIYLTYYAIVFVISLCSLITWLLAGVFIFVLDKLETKKDKYRLYIQIVKKIEE